MKITVLDLTYDQNMRWLYTQHGSHRVSYIDFQKIIAHLLKMNYIHQRQSSVCNEAAPLY